ncbi:ORF3 [torque teno Delphinidae virus 45]
MALARPFQVPKRNPASASDTRPWSEKAVSQSFDGTGLYTVSQRTGPSVPRETSRAQSPIRSSPVPTATPPATNQRAGGPQTWGIPVRLMLLNMPKPLPPSNVPPIPLPFSMNIHQ